MAGIRANLMGWNMPFEQVADAVRQVQHAEEKAIYEQFLEATDQFRKMKVVDQKHSFYIDRRGLHKSDKCIPTLTHIRFKREVAAMLTRYTQT